MTAQNKMGVKPIPKLLWSMGLPMIVSMILQSVYNIVDTIFVVNMGEDGAVGNLALTYAFPIQLLIIAVGVGTGIGINAILSQSLGEGDRERASRIAGNGIFLALCIYAVFLIFGIFGSRAFIASQAGGNERAIDMGTDYLSICCILSFGSVGYTVYERFLQATGKTVYSTIAQISGAVANIVLDYVFIYPLGMGVAGAAWATVIGQILSLVVAMAFHYGLNREISAHIKYIKPSWGIIKGIYKVGISAAIMQGLLSVMMYGMTLILGIAEPSKVELLQGSFGIYYKIMQFALFAAFGISNTIITVLSFNYGMGDKSRIKACIKYGIIISVTVSAIITVLFEVFAYPLAQLFGLASGEAEELIPVVALAVRAGAVGYIFMGISVAVQGVFQGFRFSVRPLIISFLRLVVFVLPIAALFTLTPEPESCVWWSFPITEFITAAISLVMLRYTVRHTVDTMPDRAIGMHDSFILTVSREHGSNGKYVGKLVAKQLGIAYYDKEILAETAKSTGLADEYIANVSGAPDFRTVYLSTAPAREAIAAKAEVVRAIAERGDCVIIGRGADYILKDYKNAVHVFIYADEQYKIDTIKKLYGDDEAAARRHMVRSDRARSAYYEFLSGRKWGERSNYDLCIDSSGSPEKAADAIVYFVCSHFAKFARGEGGETPEDGAQGAEMPEEGAQDSAEGAQEGAKGEKL